MQLESLDRPAEDHDALVAVIDVGKTHVKLAIAARDGAILEQSQTSNEVHVLAGEPWRRHDLAVTEEWLIKGLTDAARRYRISHLITTGHGTGGVLISPGDLGRSQPVLPMIDYEQEIPEAIATAYKEATGGFFDRGSAILHGATHQARQMMWVEREMPDAFAIADAFLGLPQYWAWRLSGVASSEITYLAAQSDLWNVRQNRPSAIVERRGWSHLIAPMVPAYRPLGVVRPGIAARTGLPGVCCVLAGIHDSSANFYRYQAYGLSQMTVVSTGTWIVALSDHADLKHLETSRAMTLNADVAGDPLGGALTMGGREFSAVAGHEFGDMVEASLSGVRKLIVQKTFALPSFGMEDGLFPGSAGRGRIEGPEPETADDKKSLAVLNAALLTTECLVALANRGTIVLDGPYLKDPLYAPLVAALANGYPTRFSRQANGVASGAALLAEHGRKGRGVAMDLETPEVVQIDGLVAYADEWRRRARMSEVRPVMPVQLP